MDDGVQVSRGLLFGEKHESQCSPVEFGLVLVY